MKQLNLIPSLVILCLLLLPYIGIAQSENQTYELTLKDDQYVERTTELNDAIILTHVEASVKSTYMPSRRYIVLDTSINPQIDSFVTLPFRNKHKAFYKTETTLYDFFYDYRKGNYAVVSVSSDEVKVESGQLPNRVYEPQVILNDDMLFVLDRRVNKEKVHILSRDSKVIQSTVVQSIKKRTKVYPLYFNRVGNSDHIAYIWREKSHKVDDVYVVIWDETGKELMRYSVQLPKKHVHLISIRQLDEDNYLLTGTYSKPSSIMASGVFVRFMEEMEEMETKMYSFSNLPHYFDYLDRYEKEEMKRKLARLKKYNKSTEVRTHAIIHDVIWTSDAFLMPIEFYTESFVDYYGINRNGNTIAGSPQSFKGFDFTHALVLRLDSLGEFKHDYYVPIELEYLAQKRETQIQTCVLNDTLLLGYASKNDLYFGSIRPVETVTMVKDTIDRSEPRTVRKEAKFVYLNKGTVVTYGFKRRRLAQGLLKKADIYFIEKRKVR
ncbi:MAG: hypothetical protein ACI9JN_000813 [Bacteroidia bacterium]|jgi:hypothetical protein